MIRVKFWGTRGSVPTPGSKTSKYGGNTACAEIRVNDEIFIFDAGTGIRELGLALKSEFGKEPINAKIFISHTHWDHIQGFPFFIPFYEPQNTFSIYGSSSFNVTVEKLLDRQMEYDFFPVELSEFRSKLKFIDIRTSTFKVDRIEFACAFVNHPGMTVAYRLKSGNKSIVYATDNEPYTRTLSPNNTESNDFAKKLEGNFITFIKGADLLIIDGQYTDEEYEKRIGWGHRSVQNAVDVALLAGVKKLAIFHHDPLHTDTVLDSIMRKYQGILKRERKRLKLSFAREGETTIIK